MQTCANILDRWRSGTMPLDWLRDRLPKAWARPMAYTQVSVAEAVELWRAASSEGTVIPDRPLPNDPVLTVHRAQRRKVDIGVSWSLSKTVALMHGALIAEGDPRTTVLLTAEVSRKDVLAYLSSRPGGCHEAAGVDQREVIADPASVHVISQEPIEVEDPQEVISLMIRARAENGQPVGVIDQLGYRAAVDRFGWSTLLVDRPLQECAGQA